jgi:acetylglutamate kinase
MRTAGIEPAFIGGLRVTDDASMEVVSRVLIGSINSDLVRRLCGAGLRAVGLSGVDAALIEATVAIGPGGEDLGRVGRVAVVRPELLGSLLAEGYTPVIASVALGDDGGTLNVNADAVAGAVAGALQAAKLVYLTNVEGLYGDLGDSGSLISELKRDELSSMASGLSSGMRPKAESSVQALDAGVGKVHILDGRTPHALLLEIFTDEGIGTQVLP